MLTKEGKGDWIAGGEGGKGYKDITLGKEIQKDNWLTFRQVSLLGGTWLFCPQTQIALENSYSTGKKKSNLKHKIKNKIWEHFKINETSGCSQQTEV